MQMRIFTVTAWLQVEISGGICLRIESLQRTIIYRDKVYTREGMPTERNALAPSEPCPLIRPRSEHAGTLSYDDFLC